MRLSIFAAGWGRTALIRAKGMPTFLSELKQKNFAGLEATAGELGPSLESKVEVCRLLKERGLRLIYSAYTSWDGYEGMHPGYMTPDEHLKVLQKELACAAELEAAVPGMLAHVNVHGGCDTFDEAEADAYYAGALDLTDGLLRDVPSLTDGGRRGISHETHRGRPLFHPTPTRRLLAAHGADRLRLTLDMSHWHVASERAIGYASTTNRPDPEVLEPANVLWGAQEAAAAPNAAPDAADAALPAGVAIERRRLHELIYPAVEHIHARIGTSQTPQTPPGEDSDPATTAAHVAMWRSVWGHLHSSGTKEAIMTPEYGPGYFTGQSCVRTAWSPEQLWEQTLAAAEHMQEEFDRWKAGQPPTGVGPRPHRRGSASTSTTTSPSSSAAAAASSWAAAAASSSSATTTAAATTGQLLSAADLPVIDISRYIHGDDHERAAVAGEWDNAFVQVGFCQLKGYESLLPDAAIGTLREAATRFFVELPHERKMRSHVDGEIGYLAVGEENVAATLGAPNKEADLVEGIELSGYAGGWRSTPHPSEVPWVTEPYAQALPADLREAAAAYWVGGTALMHVLLELSARALDLPPAHFAPYYTMPGCNMRLAYYPPGNALDGQLRYGAHTDYEGFTILQRGEEAAEEGNGGLEVKDPRSGVWSPVPAKPGHLTINIGDLMERWTNDRWRATTHRVRAPTHDSDAASRGRLSVVFFTGPNPTTVVECLPSSKCDAHAPKYGPITLKENVADKLRKAAEASK